MMVSNAMRWYGMCGVKIKKKQLKIYSLYTSLLSWYVMKKLKKLLRRFSVRHNLGLKIHLAREDVLEELLKINLLKRGCDLLSTIFRK